MALPNLGPGQVETIVGWVADYIEGKRQTYLSKASPLDNNQKTIMTPFFPDSVLNSTQVVVLAGERVSNPTFYPELVKMGFQESSLPDFPTMAAITFVDTIVFHQPIENQTLFHELVHRVQYEKLGLAHFAAKYVYGFLSGGSYMAIPLEQNAYELDERFAEEPKTAFSVEEEVQEWIDFDVF